MKKLFLIGISVLLFACNSNTNTEAEQPNDNNTEAVESTDDGAELDISKYDPHRGEGKFKETEYGPFDAAKAEVGRGSYEMKCQSCHKLTDERLVGPGWAGVTQRRTPAWLLNFITNPDEMLDKDPELQAQLEICLVRMPNQNVNDDEAISLVEFMRQNDGAK